MKSYCIITLSLVLGLAMFTTNVRAATPRIQKVANPTDGGYNGDSNKGTITLKAMPDAVCMQQGVMLIAQVKEKDGSATNSGSVTFHPGGTASISGGVASISNMHFSSQGEKTVTASAGDQYSPDPATTSVLVGSPGDCRVVFTVKKQVDVLNLQTAGGTNIPTLLSKEQLLEVFGNLIKGKITEAAKEAIKRISGIGGAIDQLEAYLTIPSISASNILVHKIELQEHAEIKYTVEQLILDSNTGKCKEVRSSSHTATVSVSTTQQVKQHYAILGGDNALIHASVREVVTAVNGRLNSKITNKKQQIRSQKCP